MREQLEKAKKRNGDDRAALAHARAAMVALSKQIEDATADPVE